MNIVSVGISSFGVGVCGGGSEIELDYHADRYWLHTCVYMSRTTTLIGIGYIYVYTCAGLPRCRSCVVGCV